MASKSSTSSRARTNKPRSAGGAFGGIIGAIVMSVIAGVLVTAAVTPLVAVSGAAATSAIGIFEKLPDHIDPGRLAEPSTIYAKQPDGKLVELTEFYDQDRETVAWNEISQYIKDAVVAEEDPRFYTHGGVDVLATSRAVLQNVAGSGFSGASTISMQYVRNVLIQEAYSIPDKEKRDAAYDEAMKQTMDRKLKEMRLAIGMEKKYSKDEILLGYLNIALYGRQIYGIESAAQYYYGKSAKDVTLPEAASLVAIVNNPSVLQIDLEKNLEANKQRRDKILGSMLRTGKITQQQHDDAVATPIKPKITPRLQGCNIAEDKYGAGHFCDYVQRYIKNDPNFGDSPAEREFNFARGGYEIVTTLDLDMQKAANDAIHATVPASDPGIKIGAATVSTEVGTGRVLTMAQNKPFNNAQSFLDKHPDYTANNFNVDADMGGSSGFQIGSTFKPMTLTQWIKDGHSVRDIVNLNARKGVPYTSFRASCMPGGVAGYGTFDFQNDNNFTVGNRPVITALEQSVNGGLVSMQQKLDLCDTISTAQALGLHRASPQPRWTQADVDAQLTTADMIDKIKNPTLNGQDDDLTLVPSNVYGGVDEIAPMTMALAYGAFAGDGTVCKASPIDSITDADGEPVPFEKGECHEAISPEVAAGVAYTLQSVVERGLGGHARSNMGIPHLAKTGTTDDAMDNWTVGSSSKVSTATWVGNYDPVCNADECHRVSTFNYPQYQQADQTIWPATMNVADQKYGGEAFPEPSKTSIRVTLVQVPDVTGKSFDEATDQLTKLGFTVADGGEVDSSEAKGTIARTDPKAGESIGLGSGITLYRSNGKAVKVPDGLVGSSSDSAQSTLRSAGFSDVATTCEAGGKARGSSTVVSVDPSSGTEALPGDRITLTLDCSSDDGNKNNDNKNNDKKKDD